MNPHTRVNTPLSILAFLLGLFITGSVLTTPAAMLLADNHSPSGAENILAGEVEPDHG